MEMELDGRISFLDLGAGIYRTLGDSTVMRFTKKNTHAVLYLHYSPFTTKIWHPMASL
jgi:hypothetical protein